MRRRLQTTFTAAGAVLMLLAATMGGVWIAGHTASGLGFIERLTYRLTGGSVRLTGLGGNFPADLTLARLQLRDRSGVWLTAERIAVRWRPFGLLKKRIELDTLEAAFVHMERTPVGDGTQSGATVIPRIAVGRFRVARVELGAPLVGTPVALSLQGGLQLRSLQDVSADAVAKRLQGDGEYTLQLRLDPRRIDASLAVREPAGGPLEHLLSLPGLGALAATATVTGMRNAERVDLSLAAGDLRGTVNGSVDVTHGSADLQVSLQAPALAPRPDLAWDSLAVQGSWHGRFAAPEAAGRLTVAGLRIAGETRIPHLAAGLEARDGTLRVRATVQGLEIPGPQPRLFAGDPVTLDASLRLDQPSRPLALTAAHRLFVLRARAETAPVFERATLDLVLPDVAPLAALAAQDVHGKATVKAMLKRDGDATGLDMDANVGVTGGTAAWLTALGSRVALQLSGTLSAERVAVRSLKLAAGGLSLEASGNAARPASATSAALVKDVQARWQLQVADLAALSGDLAGDLQATGQLAGSPTALSSDADITTRLSVHGSALGTIHANVHARGLPKAPSGTLEAHGTLDDAPLKVDAVLERVAGNSLRIHVRQADWKSAHADGDMTADAALTRSRGQLRLHVGQLDDFDRLLGVSIAGTVDGSFGIFPGPRRAQAQLVLDGKNLKFARFAGSVQLSAMGPTDALAVQLRAQVPQLYGSPASLIGAASLNAEARELAIANIELKYRDEVFRLLAPARVSFAQGVAVDAVRIGVRDASLEIAGQLAPELDARALLRLPTPGVVNVFAPDLLADGAFEAAARLHGSPSSPTGRIRFDAKGVRFADDAASGLPGLDIRARAQLADAAAKLDVRLSAGSNSRLTASGTAPLGAGALDIRIGGKLDVGLVNPLLEARGLRAAGQLSVDAMVAGSAAAPDLSGGISLAHGSVRDYVRGFSLADIDADVAGRDGGLEIKSFKAKADSGNLVMTGTLGVLQPGMPLDLKITARNAQPIASSIVTANLDADLGVKGKLRERIDVAGTIHVNRATIGIPDSFPPDVAVLDVRRRGKAAPAAAEKPLVIGMDVIIKAPQQVLAQGRGLDAELGGEIDLQGTSDELLAAGGLELLRGSFTIAGNRLSFTQGRVGFDGVGLQKKMDPTLDFTAESALSDTTVTLRITGVADAPRFDFTSSTGLGQDEIMSRLLFGQPAQQLSAFQVAQIGAALATLSGVGGSGANPLVRLQKTLGLDRLTVGANTTTSATGAQENSGAAIAAGRYVSKRVYVEGKQTTAGTSQVQVDVDLVKHLKLQTRLGNGTASTQGTTPDNDPGSSIGLQYQFEY